MANTKADKLFIQQIKKRITDLFIKQSNKALNYKQIASTLKLRDKKNTLIIKNILFELSREKVLIREGRGRYKMNPESISEETKSLLYVIGSLDMKSTGKAYLIPEDKSTDIFIAAGNTAQSLNGDIVKIQLFPQRKKKKPEGKVIEIIKRAKLQYTGRIEISKNYGFFIPDDHNQPVDFFISKNHLNKAKDGQKVLAKIIDWPKNSKNPFAEIVRVLGNAGEHEAEMNSIIANYDFPLEFSIKTEKELKKISDNIDKEEIKKRRDFRKITTITIDPKDAKDFDDAISFKLLNNGNYEVGVHIADVSYYVKPFTALDNDAYERATSIYLVDRVIPMLPEKLSNKVCSLRPNEEKLCFSAVFELNKNAEIKNEWFGRTIINSDRRFCYEEVQEIIEGSEGDYKKEILIINSLATKLRKKRMEKGSIDFHSEEVKFELDNKGKPIGAYIKVQKEANKLVEDFMLLANRKIAEKIGKITKEHSKVRPFVYRIHDLPDKDKLQNFTTFLYKLGYKLNIENRKTISDSYNNLFKEIDGKAEKNMIETIAIRTMSKAIYTTDNIGHYGLGFDYYTHFTSPIRRYPDLLVHRLMEAYLENGFYESKENLEEMCEHCSKKEKNAVDAERASIKYKQVEYLSDKIGEEFEGVISGVSKYGFFVELSENKCEGMVSIRDLDDDIYYLDDENYQIIGHQNKKVYKLGDQIKVEIKRIDMSKKRIDFGLL